MIRSRRFAIAATALLAYTIGVVLWGAYVRATLSGDGCGAHWPLCNGVVFPVDPSKKTLVELTHRVTSGLCWLWTLLMWLVARRIFEAGHPTRTAAGWSIFFMTTEALVGAGLVLFEMVADNPSSARAAWMSAHLINTFLLLACLSWMAFSAWTKEGVRFSTDPRLKRLFIGAAVVVLCIGMTGAIAALGDTLFPSETLAKGMREDFSESAHVFVRHRLWHPVVALLGSAYLLGLGALVLRQDRGEVSRLLSTGLLSLVLIQIAVGFLNVALLAPVGMQLIHLLIADATWVTLTLLALSSQPRISDANLGT